jgi:hypothetical protein
VPGFEPLKLQGTLDNKLITPEFTLTVLSGSGNLALEGSMDIRRKSYTLQMGYSGLELGKLFAISDLDRISGHLNITGKEFNPANMQVKATVAIDSAGYRGYPYRNLHINLEGDQGIYQMGFRTEDASCACNLTGTVAYSDTLTNGQIAGTFNLDADRLNLYSGIAAKGSLHVDAKLSPGRFNTVVTLGNLVLARGDQAETLEDFSLSFNSTDSMVNAKIKSDFLQVDFHGVGSLADLQNIFTQGRSRGVLVVDSVVGNKVPYISVMPEMSLTAESTYDPFIGLLLNDSVFSYDKIVLKLTKDTFDMTRAEISAENFHFGKNSGYGATVNFEGRREKTVLVVKADSIRSGNISLAGLAADMAIEGDTAFFSLKASDRHDRLLYNLAGAAYKHERQIAVITTQPQWILNGYPWQVAPGEFLVLEPGNNDFKADLHWKNGERGIDIYGTMKEKIFFECRSVGVNMLVIPGMNTFGYDGEFTGKIDYQSSSKNEVGIQMDVQHMQWADMQLGQMTITGHYESDTLGNLEGELRTVMNDTSRFDLFVKFDEQDSQQSIRTDFTGIPLHYFESLLSKYISGLRGEVSGGMALTSIKNKPRLDGSIAIQNTTLRVIPLNARFYLSDDLIVFENNQLLFRDFLVMDSLKKRLHLNGAINLDDPRNITADLEITSDRLQVMNTTAKENPVFNGQVFVNSKLNLTGTVQKPSITGNIELAEGTVINYSYMEDLSVSETEKTITFASLAMDQHAGGLKPISVNPLSNMPNIEASIEIDPRSLFTIQISRGFDIGVSINGGGFLNYGLMPNKTIQLNGTYEIEKGNAELKIPGWPRKDFIITPGSSLKWNGIVDDPELNLETTSKVRGSYLNPVDGKNREIDFMVYMKLSERLSQLEIVFDVRCEDQYITSVLNSMSTDERMRQAINMLIFNSIDLPNMTSSSDYVTQQINQFWESQFNQFTKSNIKKVDLSIGIDTYTGASKGGGEQEYTSLTYEVKKNIFNNRGSVLVSGYLNDNSAASSQSNSMLENFIFEYALDTNRSKYLKVYRQQNYEDLLEGEVTKSGVGFVYRKSYNTLGEIWRRKKKKMQD